MYCLKSTLYYFSRILRPWVFLSLLFMFVLPRRFCTPISPLHFNIHFVNPKIVACPAGVEWNILEWKLLFLEHMTLKSWKGSFTFRDNDINFLSISRVFFFWYPYFIFPIIVLVIDQSFLIEIIYFYFGKFSWYRRWLFNFKGCVGHKDIYRNRRERIQTMVKDKWHKCEGEKKWLNLNMCLLSDSSVQNW